MECKEEDAHSCCTAEANDHSNGNWTIKGEERTRPHEGVRVYGIIRLFWLMSWQGGQIFQRNNVVKPSTTDVHATAKLSLIPQDLWSADFYLFFAANFWSDWIHTHFCRLKRFFGWRLWHFLVKCFIISSLSWRSCSIRNEDLMNVQFQLFEIRSVNGNFPEPICSRALGAAWNSTQLCANVLVSRCKSTCWYLSVIHNMCCDER